MPGFGDQTLQALLDLRQLRRRKVEVIARRQLPGNGVVFLDQRPPRHFGGMRGKHQFDIQPTDLTGDELGVTPFAFQALEQLGEDAVLERRRIAGMPTPNPMVLLGDIGEVEELAEGARHRQQLVV